MQSPLSLLAAFRLGRESHLQRLLTMLILNAEFPAGNTLHTPSPLGSKFLREFDTRCFGAASDWGAPDFIDEFTLPKRVASDSDNSVDWAVMWDERVWIIELKTETTSHRPTQLPDYLARANHFHPHLAIDMTYLTPAMSVAPPQLRSTMRFAHATWTDVAELIRDTWCDGSDGEREAADAAVQVIEGFGTPWREWRLRRLASAGSARIQGTVREPATLVRIDPVIHRAHSEAMSLATATSIDRRPRALDFEARSLADLRLLSVSVRNSILDADADLALRHVGPWIWDASSTDGNPHTAGGFRAGRELRFSWYTAPRQ